MKKLLLTSMAVLTMTACTPRELALLAPASSCSSSKPDWADWNPCDSYPTTQRLLALSECETGKGQGDMIPPWTMNTNYREGPYVGAFSDTWSNWRTYAPEEWRGQNPATAPYEIHLQTAKNTILDERSQGWHEFPGCYRAMIRKGILPSKN